MATTARGNRPRKRLSSGLRKLLVRTSSEIEAAMSVLISAIPKWYPVLV